ncbi:hypothetical protein SAMN06265222_1199 [Neorhodopirellula lusitana]|uniref:Uncharacterized protein n=1 Tax=Neorhodopirellula lusitana TaxID=445327 RepID=A0ABY1QM33_9BACT|nr:hypothetical protein [Neorhodopirellula lusitana]SMP75303.1 hypothetical protein SAMN06265222_1199 [Neorhodopirellula lusitana]
MRTLSFGVLIVLFGFVAALPFRKTPQPGGVQPENVLATGPTTGLTLTDEAVPYDPLLVAQDYGPVNGLSMPMPQRSSAGVPSTLASQAGPVGRGIPSDAVARPRRDLRLPLTYDDLAVPLATPHYVDERFGAVAKPSADTRQPQLGQSQLPQSPAGQTQVGQSQLGQSQVGQSQVGQAASAPPATRFSKSGMRTASTDPPVDQQRARYQDARFGSEPSYPGLASSPFQQFDPAPRSVLRPDSFQASQGPEESIATRSPVPQGQVQGRLASDSQPSENQLRQAVEAEAAAGPRLLRENQATDTRVRYWIRQPD